MAARVLPPPVSLGTGQSWSPQGDQGRHWLEGDVWCLDGPGTVPTFQSRTPASTQSDLTLRQFSVKGNFVVASFFGLI